MDFTPDPRSPLRDAIPGVAPADPPESAGSGDPQGHEDGDDDLLDGADFWDPEPGPGLARTPNADSGAPYGRCGNSGCAELWESTDGRPRPLPKPKTRPSRYCSDACKNQARRYRQAVPDTGAPVAADRWLLQFTEQTDQRVTLLSQVIDAVGAERQLLEELRTQLVPRNISLERQTVDALRATREAEEAAAVADQRNEVAQAHARTAGKQATAAEQRANIADRTAAEADQRTERAERRRAAAEAISGRLAEDLDRERQRAETDRAAHAIQLDNLRQATLVEVTQARAQVTALEQELALIRQQAATRVEKLEEQLIRQREVADEAVRTATQAQASAGQAHDRLAGLVAEQHAQAEAFRADLAAARAEAREDLAEATRAAADARTQLAVVAGERDALRQECEDLRRRLTQPGAVDAQPPTRSNETGEP